MSKQDDKKQQARRAFLLNTSASAAAGLAVPALFKPGQALAQGAPAIITSDAARPVAAQGLQLGDPQGGSMLVWSRADRPSRMIVEYSLDEAFKKATKIVGPYALEGSDFTARQDLSNLPGGREVFVRVSFQSLNNDRAISEPVCLDWQRPIPSHVTVTVEPVPQGGEQAVHYWTSSPCTVSENLSAAAA